MQRLIALSLGSLFIAGQVLAASIPVIDAGNIVQSTISAIADVQSALSAAEEVYNSYTQIANQYTQIANQVRQIAHEVQNLQHFSGSSIPHLLGISANITSTLGQAQGVSFRLSQATAQFDALYPTVTAALSAAEVTTMRLQWVRERRHAAATGVQVQAITQSLQGMATSVSQLLSQAGAARGNLDVSQIQAQQTGLTQGLLMQIQQVLAGNGRIEAQRQAEDATLQEATMQEIATATQPLPAYTGAQGRLMQYHW
jgi:type IV secretion system protein TrbJ